MSPKTSLSRARRSHCAPMFTRRTTSHLLRSMWLACHTASLHRTACCVRRLFVSVPFLQRTRISVPAHRPRAPSCPSHSQHIQECNDWDSKCAPTSKAEQSASLCARQDGSIALWNAMKKKPVQVAHAAHGDPSAPSPPPQLFSLQRNKAWRVQVVNGSAHWAPTSSPTWYARERPMDTSGCGRPPNAS
jgi:hypothetical protein